MKKIKVGYLPLYIKLYDDSNIKWRDPVISYMNRLIGMIEERGIEVVPADEVCRIKPEFDRAAEKFSSDPDICAVITQHLAYSPSLEAIDALKSLSVPIIIFDTTPDLELIKFRNEDRIMDNHGIHGVQDMCNLLKRNGIHYEICAGHVSNSPVLDELCSCVKAAYTAKTFRECRIGMVGGEFEGMGDFRISDEEYKSAIGAETFRMTHEDAEKYLAGVTESEIVDEMAKDREIFDIRVTNAENYRLATKAGLAVRRWMQDNRLDGVTVNFLHLDRSGLPKMPFAECCKVMARGLGYAGEGDNLTSGLVASLIRTFPDTTFCEMFCPDWAENKILMSHMGEMNLNVAQWKPTLNDNEFNYNSCGDTVAPGACFRPGKAVLVNLAPTDKGFSLILTEVELTPDGSETSAYASGIQGWMKPCKPLPEFLREYSMAGGTHHSAMVYGGDTGTLSAFGRMMGFRVVVIKGDK